MNVALINLPPPQSPPVPDFTIGVNADGTTYTLRFRWNTSDGYWYVRVLDEPGAVVLMGDWRCVIASPVYDATGKITALAGALYASRSNRQPAGLFYLVDTSGQGKAPGISDLGARVQLRYLAAADMVALGLS